MGIFFIQIQEFFSSFWQWVMENTPLAVFIAFIGLATLYFIRRSANQAAKSLRELEKVNALAAKNEAEALIKEQIKEFVFIMESRDDAMMPTSRINKGTEIEFGALNAIAQAYFQNNTGFVNREADILPFSGLTFIQSATRARCGHHSQVRVLQGLKLKAKQEERRKL